MKVREALRSLRVVNTHDVLKRFGYGQDVAVSFDGHGDSRSGRYHGASVYSPRFKTDPKGHWLKDGSKFFSGPRTKSVPQAKAWAEKQYGITEWAPCPMVPNAWVPLHVRKAALDAAREVARQEVDL